MKMTDTEIISETTVIC